MSASAVLKLQKAGFSTEQVEALADFMDTQAASKADVDNAVHKLELGLAGVQREVSEVRAEMRSDLKLLEQRMTVKLGGMLAAVVGILLAALRYLPSAGH